MNYFVLSQKKDTGCPVGDLRAALFDKFYPDTRNVEYGKFPWYRRSFKTVERAPFSQGMVLISSEKLYDFDIRSVGQFFYIVSDEFLSVCMQMNVDIVDSAKIQVLSKSGKEISKRKYNAVLFREFDVGAGADPASVFLENENGRPFRIKKLIISAGWGSDLFKYKMLIAGSSSLICSDRFKVLAGDFKGVSYTPLDTVLWSGIRAI